MLKYCVLVQGSSRASPSSPESRGMSRFVESESQKVFLDRESSETIDILLLVGFPLAEFVSTAVSLPASLP
jgi:hypothetical protein